MNVLHKYAAIDSQMALSTISLRYPIYLLSAPESQISLHFAFKTNCFQVTDHFEASALNDPKSH